jgi:hypothetical protein
MAIDCHKIYRPCHFYERCTISVQFYLVEPVIRLRRFNFETLIAMWANNRLLFRLLFRLT